MDNARKCDFNVRKYRSKHKYKRCCRKFVWESTAERSFPSSSKFTMAMVTVPTRSTPRSSLSALLRRSFDFFKTKSGTSGDDFASAVMCGIGMLTILVSGATSPTCHKHKFCLGASWCEEGSLIVPRTALQQWRVPQTFFLLHKHRSVLRQTKTSA